MLRARRVPIFLGQGDVIAAPAQRCRAFEAAGGADLGKDAPRTCAARSFPDATCAAIPRRRWGSGASDRRGGHVHGRAYVAPDTFPISSNLPSLILAGKNGSAIDGRAAPIRSRTPRLILRHHRVGRGEPADTDHGFRSDFLHERYEGLLVLGLPNLDDAGRRWATATCSHPKGPADPPAFRQYRASPAGGCFPLAELSATERRKATAHLSPTASFVSSSSSFSRRARFSSDPPYSSVR